ncbi:MAG: hypothetical protein HY914_08265 [Desulfomonile tiedjei]|nr:hypothetical protein [Desulfomonile tiedjei]
MAKLEELVTPIELLEVIRGGALKNQVIKKYRTSEQELAMMLLPLYRSGDLSKEDFNDFFKGIALAPKEAPPVTAPRVREDEPPSQILRSLSTGVSKTTVAEATQPAPPAVEEVPTAAAPAQPVAVQPARAEPQLEEEAEPEVEVLEAEEEDLQVEAEIVDEAEFDEAALEALAEVEELVTETGPAAAAAAAGTTVEQALESIISKLTSIDNRLAAIEKNLKAP